MSSVRGGSSLSTRESAIASELNLFRVGHILGLPDHFIDFEGRTEDTHYALRQRFYSHAC